MSLKDHDDDYCADAPVQEAATALNEALQAALKKRGLRLKGFAVVVNTGGTTGVMRDDGCTCPTCLMNMMQALAHSFGAETEVKAGEGAAKPVAVH